MLFRKTLKSNSGEVFLGMTLCVVETVTIVTIVLSAIVMQSGSNTISQANYASFAQQFGEFSDQVKIDAAVVMAETGKNGKVINNAQKFHMVANGFNDLNVEEDDGTYGMSLPVGYVIPDMIKETLKIDNSNEDIVAYLITDQIINGYENREELKFYADVETEEYHLVTSDGTVFTIPGYPEKQNDGTTKYYITSYGAYYVVGNKLKNPIKAKDFTKLYGKDFYNNVITESPIYDTKLKKKVDIIEYLAEKEEKLLQESEIVAYPIGKIIDNAIMNDNVNVYEKTDINSKILGTISKNVSVTVQDYSNGWSRVKIGELSGWIRTEYITKP